MTVQFGVLTSKGDATFNGTVTEVSMSGVYSNTSQVVNSGGGEVTLVIANLTTSKNWNAGRASLVREPLLTGEDGVHVIFTTDNSKSSAVYTHLTYGNKIYSKHAGSDRLSDYSYSSSINAKVYVKDMWIDSANKQLKVTFKNDGTANGTLKVYLIWEVWVE